MFVFGVDKSEDTFYLGVGHQKGFLLVYSLITIGYCMFKRICIFLLLTGCGAQHLSVSKVQINKRTLASTFTRAPDPLQAHPPTGDRLYISWILPYGVDPKDVDLKLSVVWRDLHEENITYQPYRRMGMMSYNLVGQSFKKSGGIFTYKVDMVTKEGKILDTFKQRMWVNVFTEDS